MTADRRKLSPTYKYASATVAGGGGGAHTWPSRDCGVYNHLAERFAAVSILCTFDEKKSIYRPVTRAYSHRPRPSSFHCTRAREIVHDYYCCTLSYGDDARRSFSHIRQCPYTRTYSRRARRRRSDTTRPGTSGFLSVPTVVEILRPVPCRVFIYRGRFFGDNKNKRENLLLLHPRSRSAAFSRGLGQPTVSTIYLTSRSRRSDGFAPSLSIIRDLIPFRSPFSIPRARVYKYNTRTRACTVRHGRIMFAIRMLITVVRYSALGYVR